jgi:hypothetical protein
MIVTKDLNEKLLAAMCEQVHPKAAGIFYSCFTACPPNSFRIAARSFSA